MKRPRGTQAPSYKAALMYLEGGHTIRQCAERYGVSGAVVHVTLGRIRAAQINVWPEDEVTC